MNPTKEALELARRVWSKQEDDLMDRRGIKWEFNKIDPEVMDELRETQAKIIATALDKQTKLIGALREALEKIIKWNEGSHKENTSISASIAGQALARLKLEDEMKGEKC